MPSPKTYTISELARRFDVTPRAIRFYEDQELLKPRRVNGQRGYGGPGFVRRKRGLRGERI